MASANLTGNPARGRFITVEGIDGAGKSSQLASMAACVRASGHTLEVTREPGGTPLAEALRAQLLHEPMDALSELLIVFAARRDHVVRVIEPALARGAWVLCDRFTDATEAYQGGGRGIPRDRIAVLADWAHRDVRPDRTYVFDVPAALAAERLARARGADRFEAESVDFFERVRATYRDIARREPDRLCLVDATRPIEQVRDRILADLREHFALVPDAPT